MLVPHMERRQHLLQAGIKLLDTAPSLRRLQDPGRNKPNLIIEALGSPVTETAPGQSRIGAGLRVAPPPRPNGRHDTEHGLRPRLYTHAPHTTSPAHPPDPK